MISRRKLAQYVAAAWVEKSVPHADLVKQMSAYLIENKKVSEVELLVKDIEKQIEEQFGVTVASVSSARPLSEDLRKHIKQLIKERTGSKSVRITEEINESLIGGAVIETPNLSIDMTLRAKLTTLRGRS